MLSGQSGKTTAQIGITRCSLDGGTPQDVVEARKALDTTLLSPGMRTWRSRRACCRAAPGREDPDLDPGRPLQCPVLRLRINVKERQNGKKPKHKMSKAIRIEDHSLPGSFAGQSFADRSSADHHASTKSTKRPRRPTFRSQAAWMLIRPPRAWMTLRMVWKLGLPSRLRLL